MASLQRFGSAAYRAKTGSWYFPTGNQDFKKIILQGGFFVDTSRHLENLETLWAGKKMLLFLRPRRFGKTLTLNMLKKFYDKATQGHDFTQLFGQLDVAKKR